MVTFTRAQRLKAPWGLPLPLPLAPTVAIAGGVLIAAIFLTVPATILESLVMTSGLPAIMAAAEPPLGVTARIALALLFGGGFTGLAWFGLSLFDGGPALTLDKASRILRGDDVHPDAPPRPPLFANRDLGTPFLDVKAPVEAGLESARHLDAVDAPPPEPVEQPLPSDLDQPMAAFDPGALLAEPLPAPEPVAPLIAPELVEPRVALIDPDDRFETFELTPIRPAEPLPLRVPAAGFDLEAAAAKLVRAPEPEPESEPESVITPRTEATVHDLLARLERGIAGRATSPKPAVANAGANSLADTLGDLRRLATGAH